ncbi:hypothetical protein J2S14_002830 [Lederbergia wuyishanensis]|uniref:Uncharacterized protein n=1 Tax=Lederbergia wuyishanensis TaxID=1347903 RepID=A0ABU0D6J6_9BACI|nr:hypothetical protein [Lederbergia wuyishanensis]
MIIYKRIIDEHIETLHKKIFLEVGAQNGKSNWI